MFTAIIATLVGVIAFGIGMMFGPNLMKVLYGMAGKPYFRTTFSNGKEGSTEIDAQFNSLFIYELDRMYQANGSEMFKPMAPENEKVAIYMYDVLSNIADDYLPPDVPMIGDIAADVPPMGVPVKQVVDIADTPGQSPNASGLDIMS